MSRISGNGKRVMEKERISQMAPVKPQTSRDGILRSSIFFNNSLQWSHPPRGTLIKVGLYYTLIPSSFKYDCIMNGPVVST